MPPAVQSGPHPPLINETRMSTPPVRLRLSWERVQRDCLTLADRLAPAGPFIGIVAVTRGGLIPAALLARALDLTRVETVCLSSYDGTTRRAVAVVKPAGEVGDGGRGWLVVDDLVDSGETLAVVRRMLPLAQYATLYAKPAGRAMVETFVDEFDQKVWVDFPWETAY
jgi:xanthine phosphoribosyltransferase